jgi:hypothetical protein
MAFDIQQARQAGYSDTEIADHLQKSSGFDVDGALKAGYGLNEIASHISQRQDAPKLELPQFAQQAQEPQPQANAGYSGPVVPQNEGAAPVSSQQPPVQSAPQSRQPPSLQQAIAPRSYGQNPQAPGAAARTISDLVSLPMRGFDAIAAGAGILAGGGNLQQAYDVGKGELSKTTPDQTATGFEKFMQPQSPAFTAGLIPYGGIAAEGLSGLAKGVPLVGKILPHIIQGATQILPVTAAQQLENVANNQPVNVGQILGTEAAGGALGTVGPVLSKIKGALTLGSDLNKEGVPLSSIGKPSEPVVNGPVVTGEAGNPVLNKSQINEQVPESPTKPVLSRLSDSDANLLSEPLANKDTPFTDYALQAKKAMQNKRELTPADIAGQKAVGVLNQIGDLRNTIGAQKGQILKDNAANTIDISDVKQSWSDMLKERLGASVDEDGNVVPSEENGIIRRPSEAGMVNQINSMIEKLPDVVSVQQGDNLKSAINDIVQNQKASQAKPINTVTEGIGKSIGAAIDGKLDESLGPNFAAVNDKYGDLRDIETQLNSRLGSIVDPETGTARHGASLMKSAIQSNADRGTKALFQRVKDYTGVDLIKDAGYAEMAMRGVGDSRINNLLTDIGEVKNALHGGIADKAFKIAGAAYNKIKGSPLDEMIDYYNKAQSKVPKPGESAITPNSEAPAQSPTYGDVDAAATTKGVPLSNVMSRNTPQAYSTIGSAGKSGDPFYANTLNPKEYATLKKVNEFNSKAQAENAPEAPPYSSPSELMTPEEYRQKFEDDQMNSAYNSGFTSEHITPHATNPATDKLKSAIKRDFFPGVSGEKDIHFEELSPKKQIQINKRVGNMNTDPDALRPYVEAGLIKQGEEIQPNDIVQWANEAGKVELKKKGVSLGNLFNNHRSGAIGGEGVKLSRDAVEPTETYYNPDMATQAKDLGVTYKGSMKADPEHGVPVDYHYFQDGGMDDGTGSFPVKGSANLKDVLDQHRGNFAKKEKLLDNQRPGSIGSALGIKPKVDNLGFYSNAEKAVNEINMPKAPADQWMKMLDPVKGMGTKADEMKWIGLDDFLKEKGNQSVSKQEIQDFIDQNKVKLEEVRKGKADIIVTPLEDEPHIMQVFRADDPNGEYSGMVGEIIDTKNGGKFKTPESKRFAVNVPGVKEKSFNTQKEAEKYISDKTDFGTTTKFQNYQLPGGSNYRELLMTLPTTNPYKKMVAKLDKKYGNWNWQKLTKEEQEELRPLSGDNVKGNDYKSPHWDELNPVAHVRVNDRTDAEGKKVLFAEELQSDWHQQGRKKGYAPDQKEYDATKKQLDDLVKQERAPENQKKIDALGSKLNNMDDAKKTGVPAAPFSKTWHELAFKRILREAAEKGYDRVEWTPGEPQAERYDLSKSVDYITSEKDVGGKHYVDISMPTGMINLMIDEKGKVLSQKGTIGVMQAEGKPLDEVVGKELAGKIINDPGRINKYTGSDLKVGGEGMKGFYDKILVDYANKYGKKWGISVKDAYLNETASNPGLPIATEYAQGKKPVHSMDITPAMRKSVMEEGQPIGAVSAKVLPMLGLTGATAGAIGAGGVTLENIMRNRNNQKNKPVSLATITKR